MGFHQTTAHKNGKGSFHQIGLVRGQFGNVPMDGWVKFVSDTGFDGWEEAAWELDLRQCDTDAGAATYAQERGSIWPKSTGWKSSPSPRTCKARRSATSRPPRRSSSSAAKRSRHTRPGGIRAIHPRGPIRISSRRKSASWSISRRRKTCSRPSGWPHHLSKLQNRKVPLPGFVGSPAGCWSHWFLFPPLPAIDRRARHSRCAADEPGIAGRAVRARLGPVQAATA